MHKKILKQEIDLNRIDHLFAIKNGFEFEKLSLRLASEKQFTIMINYFKNSY